MFHKINGIFIPSAIWYLLEFPKDLLFFAMYYFLKKEQFDTFSACFLRYCEIKRTVNKVRLELYYFIERNKLRDKRKLLNLYYRADEKVIGTLEIKMRLYFTKTNEKIEDIKESCENSTSMRSSMFFKHKGNISFYLFDGLKALEGIFCDDEKMVIGTTFSGFKIWNFRIYPHALLIGGTGSGKTNAIKYFIDNLLSNHIEIWVIDAKKVDLQPISKCFNKYLTYDDKDDIPAILNILGDCCELVKTRYKKLIELGYDSYYKAGMKPIFMIIEEHATIIEQMNKIDTEKALQHIGYLTRMARASGVFLIFIMQRPDTKFITGESRENINCRVVLGSAGDETYKMAFNTADIPGKEKTSVGQAWCKIGNDLFFMTLPDYDDKKVALYETN